MFNKVSDLKNRKIMVVGLGRTGISLTHFLCKHQAQVTVTDHKSKAELVEPLEKIKDLPLELDLGGHTPKKFLEQELIILSPGVSPYIKIFDYAKNHGVHVTGEFEFANWFIKDPVIAITGTNGKTSVSVLIYKMLKETGIKTWLGGNYRAPVIDYLISKEKAKVLVLEVSSFQLELCERFQPRHIIFTNLSENHQNRHRSMEEYVNAKRRIFLKTNQATTSVLNADDNAVIELARDPSVQKGRILYFSHKKKLEPQIMNIGGVVRVKDKLKVRIGPEIEYYSLSRKKARGEHMVENFMAALLATRENGAEPSVVQKVIDEFRGLPHRLEYVRRVGGVNFFNDSKSTNVNSVKRALDSFSENVILIMGGKDTGLNYDPLFSHVKSKVKCLVLYGETKEKINRGIGDASETFLIGTFEEAVLMAYQKSRIGDTVVLSPGCSSFDIFDSYVERGNTFKDIVKAFN